MHLNDKLNYRTPKEKNYFGSDLNKFLNVECTKLMTVNNIDVLQFKRSKNILRIIESKHDSENMPDSQFEVLDKLAKIFSYVNEVNSDKFPKLEIYIVCGNPPYEKVEVIDMITKETKVIYDKEIFKRFCNFNGEI